MRPAAAPMTAALALLAVALAGCLTSSAPLAEPLDEAALRLPGDRGLTSHAALQERLAELAPLGVQAEPIGRSVQGRDVHLARIGHGPFELWLAARHHGNEVTSTEAVLRTFDYLLGRAEPGPDALPVTRELHAHRAWLLERITFVVVPMANPDGAEADRRTNANGQDLNRDYLLFTEPESRALRDAFWKVWPDAGLDLHNMGPGDFDYDAYYPEVPRAEDDTQVLSLRNQWQVVHEVEASGAYAGGPNENYVSDRLTDPCQYLHRYLPPGVPRSVPVPPPTGDTDPTAYCEGTHDAFLTLRGAPGWTPESALVYDEHRHATAASIPWAVRLHEATIASTAFLYAGAYDACEPRVQKVAGSLEPLQEAVVQVRTEGPARFQLVWREDPSGLDQPTDELDLVLVGPDGSVQGPEVHALGYTETLASPDAGIHQARVRHATPLTTPFELRVHECRPTGAGLEVARDGAGLRVRNAGAEPLEVEVQDAAVGRHAPAPVPEGAVSIVEGNLAPKTVVTWTLALAPGAEARVDAGWLAGVAPGPARWHAHAPAGAPLLGTTEERAGPSPPVDGARAG